VLRRGRQTKVSLRDPSLAEAGDHDKSGLVLAPMHGKVLALLVEKGARVTRGQRVAIIEAMKMEHTIVAPMDGIVTEIVVAKDAQIAEGARLIVVTPPITS
jgi:3-methylcrotonyl-CoA carboxylase alpha subunit